MALNNNNIKNIRYNNNAVTVDKKVNIINESDNIATRVIDELNNFEQCIMPFGKYRGTSMKQMYLQDYKYCQWLSNNIQEPRGDLIEFIALVNKYKTV